MKIKGDRTTSKGIRRVTLQLDPGEQIVVVRRDAHYKLGAQMDDIITSDAIEEAVEVFWNIHEQKWSEA